MTVLPGNIVSTIAAMGNPGIWWVGFGAIILVFERAVKERGLTSLFIVVTFLFQWIPYAFISRILFLYHFYINVPLLCLSTTYFISKYWNEKRVKIASFLFLAIVVVLFASFYPVISGASAPSWWREQLKWLGSWLF
jgi:dolichyl-phosphate-mannose--protein O-mannosyl transferase